MALRPPASTLFPYTTLFRSEDEVAYEDGYDSFEEDYAGYEDEEGAGPDSARQPIAPSRNGYDADSAEPAPVRQTRSEEHTSELQSHSDLVCRLLLEKKNQQQVYRKPRRAGLQSVVENEICDVESGIKMRFACDIQIGSIGHDMGSKGSRCGCREIGD